jgi:hypothetical protein
VFYNNVSVGNASVFEPVALLRNTETIMLVNARMKILQVVNELIIAWVHGSSKKIFEISGTMNVDNLVVELNLQYNVGN